MKNIVLTLLLAVAVMAIASISMTAAPASANSVFDTASVKALSHDQATKAQTDAALAQMDDCCGDPPPDCPPLCPPPQAPMTPQTPMAPMTPPCPNCSI